MCICILVEALRSSCRPKPLSSRSSFAEPHSSRPPCSRPSSFTLSAPKSPRSKPSQGPKPPFDRSFQGYSTKTPSSKTWKYPPARSYAAATVLRDLDLHVPPRDEVPESRLVCLDLVFRDIQLRIATRFHRDKVARGYPRNLHSKSNSWFRLFCSSGVSTVWTLWNFAYASAWRRVATWLDTPPPAARRR